MYALSFESCQELFYWLVLRNCRCRMENLTYVDVAVAAQKLTGKILEMEDSNNMIQIFLVNRETAVIAGRNESEEILLWQTNIMA